MIEELIKKYEEELKNCIEQEEVWEKEFSKTDDENYKVTCREYIVEFRMQKVCCNRFLQDLNQLKESIIGIRNIILHSGKERTSNELEVLKNIDVIIGE